GVCQQVIFHFVWRDLLAAAIDLVRGASFHHKVAVRTTHYDVARAVEAVAREGSFVRFGRVVIGANGVGAACLKVTCRAVWNGIVEVIHDSDFVIGAHGTSLGAHHHVIRVVEPRVIHESLGHSEHLLKVCAEYRLNAAGDFQGQLCAAYLEHIEARQVVRGVRCGFQPHECNWRHHRGDVHPLALDEWKDMCRCGRRAENDGAAGVHHAKPPGRAHGEVVGYGQRAQVHGGGVQSADLGTPPDAVQVVVVRSRNEL